MAIWERYDLSNSHTTNGAHRNHEIFHNQEDTDNFQNADVVLVDGIVTLHTNGDDLLGARFIVAYEGLVDADLTEDSPTPDSGMIWYTFFFCRGPLVFRMKSKKTIPPQHKLWLQVWKTASSGATEVSEYKAGMLLLEQLKH